MTIFNSRGRTEVDAICYQAAQIPGAGAYNVRGNMITPGGRFNLSNPKTNLEWTEYRARQLPGPGQYKPRRIQSACGGRFSLAKPKSDVDVLVRLSSQLPGPATYSPRSKNEWGKNGFSIYGKVKYGNHQTTIPNAVQYESNTLPASPASTYRRDSSCSRQILSSKPSSPSCRFSGKSFYKLNRERIAYNKLLEERDIAHAREEEKKQSNFNTFRNRSYNGSQNQLHKNNNRANAINLLRGNTKSNRKSSKTIRTNREKRHDAVMSKEILFSRFYGYVPSTIFDKKKKKKDKQKNSPRTIRRPITQRSILRSKRIDPRKIKKEILPSPCDYDVIKALSHSSKFHGFG